MTYMISIVTIYE